MTLRGCRDVDNVGSGLTEEFQHVAEVMTDRESFSELFGHQRLTIAYGRDLTILNAPDLHGVLIRDLAASDDGDPKHSFHPRGSSQKSAAIPRRSISAAPSLSGSSVSRCYNWSSSNKRAIACD